MHTVSFKEEKEKENWLQATNPAQNVQIVLVFLVCIFCDCRLLHLNASDYVPSGCEPAWQN